MTGAARPGAAGTAAGASCTSDGCDGVVEPDGFCDTCGHAASPPPVVSRTAPALPLPRAAPEATGRHAAPTAATPSGPTHRAGEDGSLTQGTSAWAALGASGGHPHHDEPARDGQEAAQ